MKLSEQYFSKITFGKTHGGDASIIKQDELKTYGELCRLESEYKYSMLASGMDKDNKVYWDELATLTKAQLDDWKEKLKLTT